MNLYIYTGATDLTEAAVTAANNLTAVTEFPALVYGDTEPLAIRFTTDSSGTQPSWANVAGHVVDVTVGELGSTGAERYAATSNFTYADNTYSGTIYLGTPGFASWVASRRNGKGWLDMQIRHTDTDGETETLAVLTCPAWGSVPGIASPETIPVTYADYADVLSSQTAASGSAATAEAAAASVENPVSLAYGFENLSASFQYWDHRGDCLIYPEHTMEAYRASVAAGAKFIEIDVLALSDGALVVMHDSTWDRTTTASGAVNANSSPAVANFVVDAGSFLGGTWGNLKVPFFKDVLHEFGGKVPLIIEIKTPAAGAGILAELQRARISRDMVLINSFTASDLTPYIADGWLTSLNFVTYEGTPTPAALATTGYDWITVQYTVDTSYMDALRAAGLKVAVFTVNSHYRATPLLEHCDAIYSDDAIYLRETARRVNDPFVDQTWYHGSQAANEFGDNTGRGAFTAPDLWGYDASASSTLWCGSLQGWASPMNGVHSESDETLNSVRIAFSVKFVSAFSDTRFAWIAITKTDRPFYGDSIDSLITGYCFAARKNGTLEIFRYTSGVEAAVSIGSQTGTAISDDATADFVVTVTATNVKIVRTDVSTTLDVADATHRGAYLHAGVKGIEGQLNDFAITFP